METPAALAMSLIETRIVPVFAHVCKAIIPENRSKSQDSNHLIKNVTKVIRCLMGKCYRKLTGLGLSRTLSGNGEEGARVHLQTIGNNICAS